MRIYQKLSDFPRLHKENDMVVGTRDHLFTIVCESKEEMEKVEKMIEELL